MFNMEVDREKKAFIITASGSFTLKEGTDFINDYHSKTKGFNPQEFSLIVDGKDLRVSAADVSEKMKIALELYTKSPFKKRIMVKQKSVIASNQTNRLARGITEAESFLFVNSIEEAFTKL